MHGQFVWYELTTPDVDAAKKFYPRFTGWGTQAFDEDYTMWTNGGVPFAGIFPLTDDMKARGIPPNWMPYVDTDDVDATVARARSLGATIMAGPGDIPGIGSYAVVQDPQGATFGIYKSVRDSGAWDGTNILGRFSWHELMTTDHMTAWAFYSALFGWEKMGDMDMGGGNMYLLYGKGGKMYGGMFSMGPEMAGMHPFWLVYVHVKDVGKAVEIATRAGATVHRPQTDIPGGGSIAILGDPQGAGFAVHHAAVAQPASEPLRQKVAKKVAALAKTVAAKAKTVTARAKKAAVKVRKKATRKPVRKPSRTVRKPAKPVRKSRGTVPKTKTKTKASTRPKSRARKAPARKAASKSRAGARKKK